TFLSSHIVQGGKAMERPLTVGQLARATGVPAKTIRYYTYCLLLFGSPLHHVTCCEYNRFPTRTQLCQGKSRRRKDGTDVGTTARGVVERLHRFPRRLHPHDRPSGRVRRALSTGAGD